MTIEKVSRNLMDEITRKSARVVITVIKYDCKTTKSKDFKSAFSMLQYDLKLLHYWVIIIKFCMNEPPTPTPASSIRQVTYAAFNFYLKMRHLDIFFEVVDFLPKFT